MKKDLLSEHRRGFLLGLLTLTLMSALVVLSIQFPSAAGIIDQDAAQAKSLTDKNATRENYDIRADKSAQKILTDFRAQAGLTEAAQRTEQQARLRAEARLRQRVPALKIEHNPLMQVPEVISTIVTDNTNSLQQSKSGNRSDVINNFLKVNNELVSLTDGQVDELKVTADYTNPAQNLSFVHLEQSISGIPVFAGEVKAGFDRNGRMFRVINNLAPGLDYASLSQKFGDPATAVQQAFKHVDREITADDTLRNATASNDNKVVFGKEEDETPTTAERMYFPLAAGVARAAWRVLIWEDASAYLVIVDAETGVLLWRKNIVEDQTQPVTYNVYANPNNMVKTADNPAPLTPGPNAPDGTQAPAIPRTNVTLVGNEPPYTFNSLGWIPDGADTTEGNNARAGLDRVAPNGIDALVVGQVVGTTRIFNFINWLPAPNPAPSPAPIPPNIPINEPLNDAYQRGSVTQLFYTTNRWHDEMYLLGFTEEARNFQQNNFGRGGVGNDRVLAEAQDYSGTNNANFFTPPDGQSGRMQMYLWPNPDPDRDGDLDAEIVIHELTHGTSNRLHGNASGLGTNMARGMGEGWSDFYAHAMLSEPTDPIEGIYTTGGYSTYLGTAGYVNNYYYGIRRFPKAVISFRGPNGKPHNPLSFRHLNVGCNVEIGTPTQIGTISAFPRGPFGSTQCDQVHAAGEIWSSALWEVRAKYIQRLGHTEGTRRVLQHVTDGMKLAPPNPTFLQERDAIIAAAQAGGEQADVDDVWAGFALRGMGFSAQVIAISPANVVEAFDVPNVQNGTYVIVARHSQKALDIPAFSTTEGTGLIQYERNNGDNQQFILTRQADGTYTITVKHSGLVLDVLGASTEDGAIVAQWTSNNGSNQRWRIEPTGTGYYRVISVNSNKALDVAGVSQENGAALIQWENTGNSNQQFFFDLVAAPTPLNSKIAFTSDRNANRD